MTDINNKFNINDEFKDVEYTVPESYTIAKFRYTSVRHYSIDYWSMGIIMYKCLTGQFPFLNIESLVYDEIPYLNELEISNEAKQFISSILNKNRDERPTLAQIKQHEFFNNIDWLQMERGEIEPPYKPIVVLKESFFLFYYF